MRRRQVILWVAWCAVVVVAPPVRGQMAFAWGVEILSPAREAEAKAAVGPQVALVKELGAGWVRVEVGGSDSAEGVRWVSELVRAAGEKGVKVLPVIAPPVDVRREGDVKAIREACREEGRRWAGKLAGKVEFYEIGGRLDEACVRAGRSGEAAGDYDPAAYGRCREAVRGLAEGIREKDAKAKRVVNGGGSRLGFLQRLVDDGVEFEQVSWRWDTRFEGGVGEKVLRLGKGPVWITQVAGGGAGDTPEQERARAESLRRAAEGLYLLPEVRAVFVGELLDSAGGGRGLVGVDGSKRPAFDAYRKVIEETREKKY